MTHFLAMPWVIPVVFGCLVGMVAIIANASSSTIKSISETGLKKRMVAQGFTASDIERVVRANARHCPHCGHEYPEESSIPAKPPRRHAGVV